MSPSLREALASLTSDRRFAEITASFNGMNLRQRFPNLTREEQAEIVRAAREFVQNQPQPQTQKDASQRASLEPPPEAAGDLRGSPVPEDPQPQPPLQPPKSTAMAEDVWVTEPEFHPETSVSADPEEEAREHRRPELSGRRPLLTALAVVAAFVIAWILGRQIMTPDADESAESSVGRPVMEAEAEPPESAEPAPPESAVAASMEPAAPPEPALTEVPDIDRTAEPSPADMHANTLTEVNPEATATDAVPSTPEIAANPNSPSPKALDGANTADSDNAGTAVSETGAAIEAPIEDDATMDEELAEAVSVDSPAEPAAPSVATLPGPSENASPETPAAVEAVAVEDTSETRPRQPAAASYNPALVSQIQARLRMLGYDPGPIDGKPGPKTSNAIRAFQRDRGLRVDGEASELLLGILATYSGLQDASTQPATQ